MPHPNFIVAGAAKAGTTSLYHYLLQHNDIFLPKQKELNFFCSDSINKMSKITTSDKKFFNIISEYEHYSKFYEDAEPYTAIGDITPQYLYCHDEAIPKIKQYCGDPKIIICLRNPVDRAYSNYTHYVREMYEDCSFEQALSLESKREADGFNIGYQYRKVSLYSDHVKAYMDNFSCVKIILFDDLIKEMSSVLNEICNFLEVEEYDFDFSKKYNRSGLPKNKHLQSLLTRDSNFKEVLKKLYRPFIPQKWEDYLYFKVRDINVGSKPQMKQETREMLKEYFRDDIINTSTLIGRDLSHWLK